jgi:hypothetical protein
MGNNDGKNMGILEKIREKWGKKYFPDVEYFYSFH